MNYTEIVATAKAYSDRYDAETTDNIDYFLKMVEARINRELRTGRQTGMDSITTDGSEYYSLPADFLSLREAHCGYVPLEPITPALNNKIVDGSVIFYTITDGMKLQLKPDSTGDTIDFTYYKAIPALTSSNTTNWISTLYPDLYLSGMMVEICAFVKDEQRAITWDARFKEITNEIKRADESDRWSGSPLQMRSI